MKMPPGARGRPWATEIGSPESRGTSTNAEKAKREKEKLGGEISGQFRSRGVIQTDS